MLQSELIPCTTDETHRRYWLQLRVLDELPFLFPFTFAPFTTVGPLDGDMRKAVSFMWRRKHRARLQDLHHEVWEVLFIHSLDRLRLLAVMAYACPYPTPYLWLHGGHHKFRSRAALEIMERQAVEKGADPFFSPQLMESLMSFAPTLQPSPDELQQAKSEWLPLKF